MNYQRQENEGLTEQLSHYESNLEKLDKENSQMLKIRDDLIVSLDKTIKRFDYDNNVKNAKNDLVNILQLLLENANNFKGGKGLEEQSNLSEEKVNHDEYFDKSSTRNGTNKKIQNYVTQNYEKFKQSQEATVKKSSTDKLINQSNFYFYLDYLSSNTNSNKSSKMNMSGMQNNSQINYNRQLQNMTPIKKDGSSNKDLFRVGKSTPSSYLSKDSSATNINPKLKSDTFINKFINASNKK